jgi:hypothetical protein
MPQHTHLGVPFPGKKKILTKKDGIIAKKRVRGVCVLLDYIDLHKTELFIWTIPFIPFISSQGLILD